MSTPLVSVIVPVYNTEKYLPRCLDSLCRQTYKELEIIVVDNNSTDHCSDIIENYVAKDNRIIKAFEKKPGQGAARDCGINIAKGEWICFVDSDDYVHPRFVEILLKTVLKHDCLTAQCRLQEVYTENSVINPINDFAVTTMHWRDFIMFVVRNYAKGYAPFGVTTNIHHRSLFDNARFDGLRYGEDSYIAPKLIYAAAQNPIAIIDIPLYYYYIRVGSTLHSPPSSAMLDHAYSKECAANFWREHNEPELYDLFYSFFFSTLVTDYLRFCVYLPQEQERYEFLRQKIVDNYVQAKSLGAKELLLHPVGKIAWEEFSRGNQNYIMYGYGNYGKTVLPQLIHCGVNITEIWDKNILDSQDIEGIPLKQPHDIGNVNVILLIAVADKITNLEIRLQTRKYGVHQFVPYEKLQYGIRYGLYKKHLPFLIIE